MGYLHCHRSLTLTKMGETEMLGDLLVKKIGEKEKEEKRASSDSFLLQYFYLFLRSATCCLWKCISSLHAKDNQDLKRTRK